MNISPSGLALIKEFEGCRLDAYPDPGSGGDPWTIGYGATGPGIAKGVKWTKDQADARLAEDAERFAQGVTLRLNGAPATQDQFDAMVAFSFNVGLANFGSSTLLRLHKQGKYDEAAKEFLRWNRASGRILPGLTRRREAEAKLYQGQM